MFLRKTRIEPLPVTMSAVRMGERVLQIGVDDPAIATAIASKVGLSGHAAIAVVDDRDATRVQSATANAGQLVDIAVTRLDSLPFDADSFDLVVVHGTRGLMSSLDDATRVAAMREWRRVLRVGGRVMTIEPGTVSGVGSMFKQQRPNAAYDAAGGVVTSLEAAGFRPVRVLADREGLKFAEGVKA